MIIKESKIVHQLLPGEGNPRNSEGSFLRLRDGRIIFAYSRYNGISSHDHASCDICAVYSSDNGERFSDHCVTLVRASDYGEQNVMSASLIRLGNGDAGLLYLLKKRGGLISEAILRRSSDEMETFDDGVHCIPGKFPGYYVVNNDRVVRLSSGRLILPAAKHPTSMEEEFGRAMDGRSACYFFLSDDDGVTWRQSGAVLNLPNIAYSGTGLQEPGLVELPGGTLYAYFRTDMHFQYESVSVDGGEHWFMPQPSRFTSPVSPLHIRRNEYNGKYYAVWNPVPEYPGRKTGAKVWTGGRSPLVIAESTDGYNYSAYEVIEDDDTRGFCYPAMYFLDGETMLLAYCSGGTEDGSCLCRTTIRKIKLCI